MTGGWLREPLLHFSGLAALVFVAWQLTGVRPDPRETIRISASEIEQLAALYAQETGIRPAPTELRAIIAEQIRTEALASEGRRLGLDQDDVIVERRLAQKMEFMVSDLTEIPEPSEDALRAWYAENALRFARPVEFGFEHIYLGETDTEADVLKAALASDEPPDWRQLGAPFSLRKSYDALPLREVQRLFGPPFADALQHLPPGDQWQGPVPSAFGWHLVRLRTLTPERDAPFDDVRDLVRRDWQDAARRQANADAIADIIAGYDVIVEGE